LSGGAACGIFPLCLYQATLPFPVSYFCVVAALKNSPPVRDISFFDFCFWVMPEDADGFEPLRAAPQMVDSHMGSMDLTLIAV